MIGSALVTAIGSFAADIVIKSLKGMDYRVVGCDIYPKEWIADAGQVNVFCQVPHALNVKEYIRFLIDLCEAEEVHYLIPLTDAEIDVLNDNRYLFETRGVCICISSMETIRLCRDKHALAEFINMNYSIMETIPTERAKSVKGTPSAFPIVCKPHNGRSSLGLRYIYNEEEWKNFVSQTDVKGYLVQPYIEGSIITVDVVCSENQAVAIARQELLRTLNGAGTSVYIFCDVALERKCCELAVLLGVQGCVNFEFIKDKDGKYHFLECNPRFSGGVEFSCIAGYNCVENHIRAFDQKPIDKFHVEHCMYIARKYEEYVTRVENIPRW